MRLSVLAISALLAAAAAAVPAGAQVQPQQPKAHAKKETAPQPAPLPRDSGYREQLADKLPIGSNAWWEQMKREGRLGGETP
jgi:hypothetical protein